MKRNWIGLVVLVFLFLGAALYAYALYGKQTPSTPALSTSQEGPAEALPPDYDPLDEERWVNDYWFRADGHRRIATAQNHTYFCKLNERYEGPTSCYLFLEKGGVYTPTGLLANDVDTTLLVSGDGNYIVVIEPDTATLIRVADDQRRTLYTAQENEELGYYGNTDFRARARWVGNSVVEMKIFPEGSSDDSSPLRTASLSI